MTGSMNNITTYLLRCAAMKNIDLKVASKWIDETIHKINNDKKG